MKHAYPNEISSIDPTGCRYKSIRDVTQGERATRVLAIWLKTGFIWDPWIHAKDLSHIVPNGIRGFANYDNSPLNIRSAVGGVNGQLALNPLCIPIQVNGHSGGMGQSRKDEQDGLAECQAHKGKTECAVHGQASWAANPEQL
jgi:hypothetical protein